MADTWIKGFDGQTTYIDLDKAQKLFSSDNGDGTWIVSAQFSDYAVRILTTTTYLSQGDANGAIESYLGANLISTI